MKVALVHDWLTGMRGGEKVLEVLCELFPDADLYTLLHVSGSVSSVIEDRRVFTSFLQKIPAVNKFYRYYLPVYPKAIERFDLNGYDLVLSSSHCVAKGIKPERGALHICYCHTPMRYIWDKYDDYFNNGRGPSLSSATMPVFAQYLRNWDVQSTKRVDRFIANSHHVAGRIERYYHRQADVIHAPVDTSFYTMGDISQGDYYLAVSAMAPYKKLEIAVEAFNVLGYPLKVIGKGTEEKCLKRTSRSNIEFSGWIPDNELRELYRHCKALIFTAEEDFGIVPLEAMACGKPVIAYGKGGILETVVPLNAASAGITGYSGETPTGVFFYEHGQESLIEAIRFFEKNLERFNNKKIRDHALRFDRVVFKTKISNYITKEVTHLPGANFICK